MWTEHRCPCLRSLAFVAVRLSLLAVCLVSSVKGHSEYIDALLSMASDNPSRRAGGRRAESSFFRSTTQITHGGTNAEAYWSFDDSQIIFQGQVAPYNETHPCDLIFTMRADGSQRRLVSPVAGRDTCAYFTAGTDNEAIIFSSTMSGGEHCPPKPDMNFGYVWPLNPAMDIYWKNVTSGEQRLLFASDAYDAEATLSADGKRMVFTSAKDGDLELYMLDLTAPDAKPRRLTASPGYDGGAYFSHDGTRVVWRASRPRGQALLEYTQLLSMGYVIPLQMEIYVMDLEGAQALVPRRLTNYSMGGGAASMQIASFAPFFLPDDSGIIFASNKGDGRSFHLYTIALDGGDERQVTTEGHFNSFPMFSFDGQKLAFSSDRNAKQMGQMDVYVADWIGPGAVDAAAASRGHISIQA